MANEPRLDDDADGDDPGTTGMHAREWRIALESPPPVAKAWQESRAAVDQGATEEVRLLWRVIETVGDVSWPSGLGRLH